MSILLVSVVSTDLTEGLIIMTQSTQMLIIIIVLIVLVSPFMQVIHLAITDSEGIIDLTDLIDTMLLTTHSMGLHIILIVLLELIVALTLSVATVADSHLMVVVVSVAIMPTVLQQMVFTLPTIQQTSML